MSNTCSHCGAPTPQDDRFCRNCGVQLDIPKEAPHEPPREPQNKPHESTEKRHNQTAPLSFGDCLLIGLLFMIPVVNIIVLLLWALDKDTNVNRKNIARAGLVYMGISIVLSILFAVGLFRAITLDQEYYYDDVPYEYYIGDPEFDQWLDFPFDTNEL